MEYQINDVPFEMNQISAQLFNNKFLSDITFNVEGQLIYAHSLELMKRSTVFQQQLESTLGEKKIIPITDYGFFVFYEFIRFIYTDIYNPALSVRIELLKLANAYNITRLVNVLLAEEEVAKYDYSIKKLDFCVAANHKIALNDTKFKLASNLSIYLKSKAFLSICPDTIEQILNFDQIIDVKETDLLDALVRWIKHANRQNLDKFIRLIRFPAMSNEELADVRKKYPDLLSSNDFLNIAGQKIFGLGEENCLWNRTPRMQFISPYELKEFPDISEFITTFSVSSDMILGGFVLGLSSPPGKQISIQISRTQPEKFGLTEIININTRTSCWEISCAISLGASIRIRPNFTYVIGYKVTGFSNFPNEIKYWSRKPEKELIINDPQNSAKIMEAHETMFEIMLLKPE